MMNITFLTGHLAKERHMLLYELAESLSLLGAKVTVITGFPSRRISDEVRKYYLDHPVENINENLTVKRVGSKKGEGTGLLSRFIKYISLVRTIKKEALKIDTDCFYIYSSPPFLGYCAKKLSKKAPVVYNAQDIFPDSLFALKPFVKKTIFGYFFRKKEEQVYKYSKRIITISEAMKKTIAERCDNPEKIDVIYNWSDFHSLQHIKRSDNTLLEEFNIPKDKFIVSYGGDIGMFQNWDLVLSCAGSLKDNDNILFVVFGNGSKLDYVRERILTNKLDNFLVFPMQPKNRISEVYSLGDIELVSLSPGLVRYALPSKIYNIFACKKPILAVLDETSEYFDLINNNGFGYAVNSTDFGKLKEAILMASMRHDLEQCGYKAFNYLKDNCSRDRQTKLYFDLMNRSLSK